MQEILSMFERLAKEPFECRFVDVEGGSDFIEACAR